MLSKASSSVLKTAVSARGLATAAPRIGDTKVKMSVLDKGTRQYTLYPSLIHPGAGSARQNREGVMGGA